MTLKNFSLLLLCNVLWASNPTLAKELLSNVGPALAGWIKYSGAIVAYIATSAIQRRQHSNSNCIPFYSWSKSDLRDVFLIGFFTFFISPTTQMFGLKSATAMNNSILVSLEPLLTCTLGVVLLKEKLPRTQIYSIAIATLGFALLSNPGEQAAFAGNLLITVAILSESIYSICGKKLSTRHSASAILGKALFIGLTFQTLLVLSTEGFHGLFELTPTSTGIALWYGPISTFLPYIIWLHLLKEGIPLSTMAATLFLQPLLGAAFGFKFLDENLTILQILGAILILFSVKPKLKEQL